MKALINLALVATKEKEKETTRVTVKYLTFLELQYVGLYENLIFFLCYTS